MWINQHAMLRGALLTGLLSIAIHAPAQEVMFEPAVAVEAAESGSGIHEADVMFFHAAGQGGSMQAMPATSPMMAPMMGGALVGTNADVVEFIGPMGMMGGGTVKGVPYSATATTEMTQRLVDGNRISRKNSSQTYRDGEGRTRRDQTLPTFGPFAVSGPAPSISFISDPVAKVTYVLNHTDKTARQMPAPQWISSGDAGSAMPMPMPMPPPMPPPGAGVGAGPGAASGATNGVRVFTRRIERGPAQVEITNALPNNFRREELGKQLVEGIEVEGTRTVMTIPAGSIGNDLAIEIVTEEWRSPVLQVMVSTRHTDPRMGENTYRLTSISRAEPDASLFKVPAGYQLIEGEPAIFNLSVPPPTLP